MVLKIQITITVLLFLVITCSCVLAKTTPTKPEEMPEGMVFIKGGTFQMGVKGDQRSVTVDDFYMSKYEVTNKEYCALLNSAGNETEGTYDGKPAKWIWTIKDFPGDISEKDRSEAEKYFGITGGPKAGYFKVKPGYEDHPVVCVTWYGAVVYCNWLSEMEGLEKCYGKPEERGNGDINKKGYRLPTEAEWEYAHRAGTTTAYYWGDDMDGSYCWYDENSGGNHHSVGKKLPNAFGLYDMSGNVFEWCNDWHGDYPSGYEINPAGPESGSSRVFRGGCWSNFAGFCRSGVRFSASPDYRNVDLGFRLVRSAP